MNEEIKTEVNSENNNPTIDRVDVAMNTVREMKIENDRMEKNIAEFKKMEMRKILGGDGKTEYGNPTQEKPREETAKEYALKIMSGVR